MHSTRLFAFVATALALATAALAQPPASQPPRPVASVNTQPRVDVADMPRPIDLRDTLWIEDLTMLAEALNAKWKAAAADARAYSIPEYCNYGEVEQFEQSALGIHEKMEGLHDDYYISAIIAVPDPNGVRMPERVKAGKFVINGVSLAPIEKTVENGRKIIAFRTEKTVAAIRKAMEAAKAAAQ